MGLDMEILSTEKDKISNEDYRESRFTMLGYWRKCYTLNEWMADLYFGRGGEPCDYGDAFDRPYDKYLAFNNVDVELKMPDLIWLEQDIINGVLDLRDTTYGEYFRYTLDVIGRAMDEIKQGRNVFYSVDH